MRTRSISILASSFIAALLGCPLEGMQAPDGSQFSAESDAQGSVANSESHDDAVDAVENVSWARQDRLPPGSSALRVLMTDAPVEAESVFVTFCGIFVHSAGSPTGKDGRDAAPTDSRGEAGAGARDGRDGGAAGAPAETARGGAGGASAGDAPAHGASDDGTETEGERAEVEHQAAEQGADEIAPGEPEGEAVEPEASEPGEPGATEPEAADPEAAEGRPANDRGDAGAVGPDTNDAPGGAWQAVSEGCQTLDLLTLRDGVTEAVGVANLPPGHYGQIRLMLVDASIVVDGVEHELSIPSGVESGLKINGAFALHDGAATTITLDFDAGRSVHYTEGSGYIMRPVINVIDVTSHAGTAEDGEKRDPAASPETRDPRENPEPRAGERPREGGAAGAGAGGAGSGGAGAAPSRRDGEHAGDPPPPREPREPGEQPPAEEPEAE